MNQNNNSFQSPTAIPVPVCLPSPLQLPAQTLKNNIKYHFIIKKRLWWCYGKYLKLELNENFFVIKYNDGILEIPRNKSIQYTIDILKTIGIKNKKIFKVFVMNGEICMSKKICFDLNTIINFVLKTEMIMENVKYS